MDRVKVKKSELIQTISENQRKHIDLLEKAYKGYRKKVIEEVSDLLKKAEAGEAIDLKKILLLVEPISKKEEYERALKMLNMSIEDEVTINEQEFRHYVLDEWSWKDQVDFSNTRYL